MNARTKKLRDEVLELPREEALALAHDLLESLGNDGDMPEEIKKAWDEEIKRRLDDVVSGRTKTIDMNEAMAQLRARHARR
jgi:putative addiction module component (TIGR02574 family)